MSGIAPASEGGSSWAAVFLKPSRALALVITIGYAVALVLPVTVDYLALVPGKTIPFGWNLITATYFEHRIAGLALGVPGLLFLGRLLEPVWGTKEFLKFTLLVGFFSSVCTFMVSIIFYYVTGHDNLLYTPIAGLHGVLAGFLVAIKQIFPDSDLFSSTLPFVKVRAKWLPSVSTTIVVTLGCLLPDPIAYVPFVVFGTYGSWLYLRYFQRRSESTVTGDPSGEFAFQTFFPEVLWPVLSPLCSWCDKLCCGRRAKQIGDEQGEEFALGENPLPGSDAAEANRRRERGARALEERLVVAATAKPAAEV